MSLSRAGGESIDTLKQLIDTLRFLRSAHGCPWDRAQSLVDLCGYLIDEAYELQDAARGDDPAASAEEIGDVLFLVLSCALWLQERHGSDLDAIARGSRDKIVRRHPHVFADREATTPAAVTRHWRDMKDEEARSRGEAVPGLLDKLPRSLPPLRRAMTVQRLVASVGFEWETAAQVHRKIVEEAGELREALASQDARRIQDELGDMLFSVANLARFLGVDPEAALTSTVEKFVGRFQYVERGLHRRGQSLEAASLQEMDALWEEAKRHEAKAAAPPEEKP